MDNPTMTRFEQHFTIDEANELLPEIRAVLARARDMRDTVLEGHNHVLNDIRKGALNGGNARVSAYLDVLTHLTRSVGALQERGLVIQDIDRCLVDFPAIHDGREVLLCYELSDGDVIRCYHEVNGGYASRRPI